MEPLEQMAFNSLENGQAGSSSVSYDLEPACRRENFLCHLFSALDRDQVRYCVLHSWKELPQQWSSDLDIAVHPDDDRKLISVFRFLREKGYSLLQVINYSVDAYCFRFSPVESAEIDPMAVDVIFRHQRGVSMTPSVEMLVSRRRRYRKFWIPAPESEFTYLLARRAWKGTASPNQTSELQALVERLGRPAAESLAAEVFIGQLRARIVDACASGQLNPLLSKSKSNLWITSAVRNPVRLIADLISNAVRLIRRWLQPTGVLISVMGPDGAGKSTLVEHLLHSIGPGFDRHRLFHWRPALIGQRKIQRDTTRPHSQAPYGQARSVAKLLAYVLDYWLGYWFVIRPFLARSGLVIFDRYFDDILIDPKRYRYAGPLWLVQILGRLIPQSDLTIVLDAPPEIFLARKQEIEPAEMQRQRELYSSCKKGRSSVKTIDANGSISQVASEAAAAVIEHLSQRVEQQHARWLLSQWDPNWAR